MPQTAADRILKRLADPDSKVAKEAAKRLQWGNFNTIDRVLAAVNDGAPIDTWVAAEMATGYRLSKQVDKMWSFDTVFEDDTHFTSARLALLTSPRRAQRVHGADWDPFTAQVRRMWRAGRLRDTGAFLNYAWTAVLNGDKKFAVELLAHTPFKQEFVAYKADFHTVAAAQFVAKNWAKVEAKRERLFETVWLRGQIPSAEWDRVKHVPRTLRRDLYDNLHAGGYNGYVTHVLDAR